MSDVYFIVGTMINGKPKQLFPLYEGKEESFCEFKNLFEMRSVEEVKKCDCEQVLGFMANMYFMACARYGFDSVFEETHCKDKPCPEILVTVIDEKTNKCLWGFTICLNDVAPIYKFIDWTEKNIVYKVGETYFYDYINSK